MKTIINIINIPENYKMNILPRYEIDNIDCHIGDTILLNLTIKAIVFDDPNKNEGHYELQLVDDTNMHELKVDNIEYWVNTKQNAHNKIINCKLHNDSFKTILSLINSHINYIKKQLVLE